MEYLKNLEKEKEIRDLVHIILKDRPEAFQDRVIQMLLRSGIDANDPVILPILSCGTVEATVHELPITLERYEARLNQISEKIEVQSDHLNTTANDIFKTCRELESRNKRLVALKLPGLQSSQPKITQLLCVALATFAITLTFSDPIKKLGSDVFCHTIKICKVNTK
jgi:hypothetical protein